MNTFRFSHTILTTLILTVFITSPGSNVAAQSTDDIPKLPRSISRLLKARKWESFNGKFKTEAKYAGFDPTTNSVLLDKGNSIVSTSFMKLSKVDRSYVTEYLARSPEAFDALYARSKKNLASLESQLAELDAKLLRLNQERIALEDKVKKLAQFAPSNKLADDDGVAIVNQNILELKGRDMLKQEVKLLNCKYSDLSNLYEDEIPNSVACFVVHDPSGDSMRVLVDKETYGDFLLGLKRRDRLNIKGSVTAVRYGGVNYLIYAKTIEKVE